MLAGLAGRGQQQGVAGRGVTIDRDRVEGTVVYDRNGNRIGSVKRLMIDKKTGQVAYTVVSFGGFPLRQ